MPLSRLCQVLKRSVGIGADRENGVARRRGAIGRNFAFRMGALVRAARAIKTGKSIFVPNTFVDRSIVLTSRNTRGRSAQEA